jgi:protein required for attachment to host cells
MKKHIWILVANSSNAIIYEALNNHSLKELERLEHPASRLHDQDLVSSRPGRSFDSIGPARHAMEYTTSPKTHEFQLFAQELVHHLEKGVDKALFNRLYIAATPHFLGILREALPERLKHLVIGEVHKDLTQAREDHIRQELPDVL